MDKADVTEELGREWWGFWDLNPQSSKAFREAYNPPYIVAIVIASVGLFTNSTVLIKIAGEYGPRRIMFAPYYILKKRVRIRMIDFIFFWLSTMSMLDLIGQCLLLPQTFRGDSFVGSLHKCKTILAMQHFSRIGVSICVFKIASYRLNLTEMGFGHFSDLTQKAIDKAITFAFLAVFLYAAYEAYLAFGFAHRGSFDDLDTFTKKARFLAVMIFDGNEVLNNENQPEVFAKDAFHATCAPHPYKFGHTFDDSELRFAFMTLWMPIIGIIICYSRMSVLLKKSYKILGNVPHLNARIRSQRLDRAVIKKFIVVFLAYLFTIGAMRLSLIFIPENVVDERQTTYVQKRILEYGKLLLLIEPALNPLLYPLLSSSGSFGSFYRDLKRNFTFKRSVNPSFLRKLNKASSRQNEIALVNLT